MEESHLPTLLQEAGRRPYDLFDYNDGRERLPCPVCEQLMDQTWIELLALNRCAEHGIWFQAGDLERVLEGDVLPQDVQRQLKYVEAQRKARSGTPPK